MVTKNGLRPFQRMHDGVLIYLSLDEWPSDVPLPGGRALVETGEGPFCPYWYLVLKPQKTVEAVVGWFKVPFSLDETVRWYQTEMMKSGWRQDSTRGHKEAESAGLNFEHPATGARLEISLRRWTHKQETTAMIRRVVEHPWPETAPVEAEQPLPRQAAVPVPA